MVVDLSLMEVVLPNGVEDKVDLLGSVEDKITQHYRESAALRSLSVIANLLHKLGLNGEGASKEREAEDENEERKVTSGNDEPKSKSTVYIHDAKNGVGPRCVNGLPEFPEAGLRRSPPLLISFLEADRVSKNE